MDVAQLDAGILLRDQLGHGGLGLLHREVHERREARLQAGEGLEGGAGTRVLVVIERQRAVVVGDGHQAALEPTLTDRHIGPLLAGDAQLIALLAGPPVDAGDQIGRQPLGHLRVLCEQVFVVGVEPVGAVARRAAHRLDATTDHQILVAGQYPHRGEGDGLLATAAEPIEGDARNRDRPAGVEHGHATDVVRVVAGMRSVAADDVVDVCRVEADTIAQALEDLGQDPLGVQVREGTLARLATATR